VCNLYITKNVDAIRRRLANALNPKAGNLFADPSHANGSARVTFPARGPHPSRMLVALVHPSFQSFGEYPADGTVN
jgi:hypothetical protein